MPHRVAILENRLDQGGSFLVGRGVAAKNAAAVSIVSRVT